MSAMDNAMAFFHACESLAGWSGCRQYVADNAGFVAQSEPLTEIDTVQGYCEWMAGLGSGPLAGCGYEIHAQGWDEANSTAVVFATFTGTHGGEGGPVAATHKQTRSHYVYSLKMDGAGKVAQMTKIWNAPWALRELGWAS